MGWAGRGVHERCANGAAGEEGLDVEWASTGMHAQFWEQVVDWSLRAVDSGKNLSVVTELATASARGRSRHGRKQRH